VHLSSFVAIKWEKKCLSFNAFSPPFNRAHNKKQVSKAYNKNEDSITYYKEKSNKKIHHMN
jgi:hypothetical protein